MKVLFLNVCNYGSTGKICYALSDKLFENNANSLFLYGRGNSEGFLSKRISTKLGIGFDVLITRLFDLHGLTNYFNTIRIIKTIKQFNPDIIHLHNIHGYYVNYEWLFRYLKTFNKPIVWTLHDCWAITGHCAHFDYSGCNKWISGCNHCSITNAYPASWGIDNSSFNYKKKKELFSKINELTIVVPSKWLNDVIARSYLKDYPRYIINNGIDLSVFHPQASDNNHEKKMVLAVANVWTRQKGYDDLIKLSQIIDQEKVALYVIGVNQKQQEELTKYGVNAFKRTRNVEELAKWYSQADVFINPTYEDTFPTVNIEALACGTPVISYNTGGSPEIIGLCGAVVDKGDISALYKAIMTISKNVDQCRERAKLFDANNKFNEYIELYRTLI